MEFKETRGIYLQIADQICDRILGREWGAEERIPAIREMAALTGVNPNTVTRSYQELLSREIIYNQRGIGYFVAEDADARIKNMRREDFIDNELPHLFKTMEQLQLDWNDITALYNRHRTAAEEHNG
jgi:DNA-binding transcriptional regulator YhcF (GntR family)